MHGGAEPNAINQCSPFQPGHPSNFHLTRFFLLECRLKVWLNATGVGVMWGYNSGLSHALAAGCIRPNLAPAKEECCKDKFLPKGTLHTNNSFLSDFCNKISIKNLLPHLFASNLAIIYTGGSGERG